MAEWLSAPHISGADSVRSVREAEITANYWSEMCRCAGKGEGQQPLLCRQIKTWDCCGSGAGRAVSIWRQRQPTIITNNNTAATLRLTHRDIPYLTNTHRTSTHYGVPHPGLRFHGGFVSCQVELFARKQRELSLLVGSVSSGEKQNSSNSAGTDSQTSANNLPGTVLEGILLWRKLHFKLAFITLFYFLFGFCGKWYHFKLQYCSKI